MRNNMPNKQRYEKEKAMREFLKVAGKNRGPNLEKRISNSEKLDTEFALPTEYRFRGNVFEDPHSLSIIKNWGDPQIGSMNRQKAVENQNRIKKLCPHLWGNTKKISSIMKIVKMENDKIQVRNNERIAKYRTANIKHEPKIKCSPATLRRYFKA